MPFCRFVFLLIICSPLLATDSLAAKWFKGNLHTHSFWSDGDDFPEMITSWYKSHRYDFLAISDHNIVLEGEKWISLGTNQTRQLALEKYRAQFPDLVQTRIRVSRDTNGAPVTNLQVRLTALPELKKLFEERGKFLLIPSEEITAKHKETPIHVNATNIREFIKPRDGTNVFDVMQNNIDAVLAQRQRTGQPMFPHLNHPNFHFAVTPEELMRLQGERFFEVYNGHPAVWNEGDEKHPSTERMWDMVLAWRLAVLDLEPMFGIGVDDSHNYHGDGLKNANPGRGWVMVRAARLTPEHIVRAMEAGDFYTSTGVRLKSVTRTSKKLSLAIDPEPGVTYMITFIGTKRDFVLKELGHGKAEVDPARIGRPLTPPIRGTKGSYTLAPDDLYVRAQIVSSKPKRNGLDPDETERAWTQPAVAASNKQRYGP
jgi:hypothetical protein